jgi:hypothetical protein
MEYFSIILWKSPIDRVFEKPRLMLAAFCADFAAKLFSAVKM